MSDSVKRNLLGILAAAGLGIVTFMAYPVYLMPVGAAWVMALLCIRTRFGAVPAYIGAAAVSAVFWYLLGPWAALFALLMTMTTLTVAVLTMRPGIRLEYSVAAVFFAMALVIFGAVAVVQIFLGDFISLIMQLLSSLMNAFEEAVPGFWDMYMDALGAGMTTKELMYQVEALFRTQFVGDALAYCAYGAVFGVVISKKLAARKGEGERFGAAFDAARWSLPKYTTRAMVAAAAILYLMAITGVGGNTISAAYAVWMLAYALLVFHGIIYIEFMMKLRGTRPGWRYALIAAVFIIFRPILFCTGLVDRIIPVRMRINEARPQPMAKRDEPGSIWQNIIDNSAAQQEENTGEPEEKDINSAFDSADKTDDTNEKDNTDS